MLGYLKIAAFTVPMCGRFRDSKTYFFQFDFYIKPPNFVGGTSITEFVERFGDILYQYIPQHKNQIFLMSYTTTTTHIPQSHFFLIYKKKSYFSFYLFVFVSRILNSFFYFCLIFAFSDLQ